jgi:gas vesicle protein
MSKKKVGFLAGLLAGAAGALLLAPKKGKELRKDIDSELEKRKFYDSKFYRFFRDTYTEIKDEGKEFAEDAEELLKKQEGKYIPKGSVEKAKNKAKEVASKAKKKTKKVAKKTTKKDSK